ncbi:MAG: lysine N(6)-hydroxylase/L-ornithine N(5)-oxygenase family protein [Agriterribacter sp.]
MHNHQRFDVIGIGIGPFNLGMAALLQKAGDVKAIFFDQNEQFNWHPGLMLKNTSLQVPFMADLVTMADPTSPYSFLNFLKQTNRIYKFYIRENFFVLRKEYNAYCNWVASQLPCCRFSCRVADIEYAEPEKLYTVYVKNLKTQQTEIYKASQLILGTGTQPYMPAFANGYKNVIHTSQYLFHKPGILKQKSVTIIGSGQSAAEVFQDLLPFAQEGLSLHWFSRPDRFFPMEYSKLTLELTSPDYVDYFFSMDADSRRNILSAQKPLYKGINYDLINDIFDTLYEMSADTELTNISICPNLWLNSIEEQNNVYSLLLAHAVSGASFTHNTDFVILATGYVYNEPSFLKKIDKRIKRTAEGELDVSRNYSIDITGQEIFVQNAGLHTHGFVTPDLGMGAYRNACIINSISRKEIYPVEKRIAFQQFNKPTA